jgi:Ser/Thr protein kinase RdoA (MazF antagonist)
LIHRDLHPANMLFDAGRLTGFIEFEWVCGGPRIFDVCYCATSLLVSAFPDPERMQRWPDLLHSLLKGDQTICPFIPAELSALYGTLAAIELLFIAFSLETHADEAAKRNTSILKWLAANRELLSA